ncbi:hypothetical protein [Ramlibacter montanisoli]|uniref:Uncharacterized protein n=1 Tax=Ramlibacter montanisoli TaxID=2732512 RepID=A0A849K291_9BURK|nr:hypothetical protein [Ramlibacter montanisoli]NNU42612.1 hypothetical protein [Ramlibacter montanisoli]
MPRPATMPCWENARSRLPLARPLAHFAAAGALEVAVQDRARHGPERRDAGEAVDHGDVLEQQAHAVPAALAALLAQRAGEPRCLIGGTAFARVAACHLAGDGVLRLRVHRVAAEEVDLLEVGEQAGAGAGAGHALQLLDGQEFVLLERIGEEHVALPVVARDDQHVAGHLGFARGRQPVLAVLLHQLDELVLVRRQELAEGLLLVGGVDGDRADGLLLRDRERRQEAGRQQAEQSGSTHDVRTSIQG